MKMPGLQEHSMSAAAARENCKACFSLYEAKEVTEEEMCYGGTYYTGERKN